VKNISDLAADKELIKVSSGTLKPKFEHLPAETTTTVFKKTASAETFNPAAVVEVSYAPATADIDIANIIDANVNAVRKLAFAVDDADMKYRGARDAASRMLRRLSKEARADVASIAVPFYGSYISGIRDELCADVELRKFASVPRVPETEEYEVLEKVAECQMILDSRKQLLQNAVLEVSDGFRKLAGAYALDKYAMRKQAGAVSGILGAAIGQSMMSGLRLQALEDSKIYEDLENSNVKNVLRELEIKRNFYEVYNDDYISTFPIEQVQQAYNTAIQKLPEKLRRHPSSATQLIRSWVTKQLSHGGVTSAEDAEDVMRAAQSMRTGYSDLDELNTHTA